MRNLFISERRYIDNILWKWKRVRSEMNGPVLLEYYSPPRASSAVLFNNDFSLQFVRGERLVHFQSFGASILPNTLGVDVFVTVDERTSQLLMTELLSGEALPMKYFKEHIEKVEGRLAALAHPINLRRTTYCRIFVIENDICFLAFPNNPIPTFRGERELLCDDADSSIACGTEGSDILYVDGWIRTCVAESEQKIEAIPAAGA